MLSIIICSKFSELSNTLKDNIKNTVGCDYEIIHIDNSKGKYNIFQAYNVGVGHSSGDVLCFMHEDVLFHSADWGRLTCQHLENKKIGAIGVAGGNAVLSRSDWRMYGWGIVNLRQGNFTVGSDPEYYCSQPPCRREALIEVAVLDGAWYCMRKELFDRISYDEKTFHDFHLYDSDICMQINMLGYKVYVCNDVDLEHFSVGTYTEGYKRSLALFLSKWRDVLPFQVGIFLTDEQIKDTEQFGINQLEARIKDDAIIIRLRDLIKRKNAGEVVRDFYDDELALMRRSAYRCVKCSIKDKSHSFRKSYGIFRRLRKSGVLPNKCKLLYKLIFYKAKFCFASKLG